RTVVHAERPEGGPRPEARPVASWPGTPAGRWRNFVPNDEPNPVPDPVDGARSQNDPEERPAWMKRWNLDIDPPVFFISSLLILLMVALTVMFQDAAGTVFGGLQASIANNFGWFFVLVVNVVLIFCVYLVFTPMADIRLGGHDAKSEFTTLGWFSMLFSAGMGIGLLFYGVAEPMFHYVAGPRAEPGTVAAAEQAMQYTFLHWGLHPWSIYALVGLALAFFSFNRGMPLTIRTVFYPLLGERIYGWPGTLIDVLATIATLFGVATSLGLGVQQVNAGLDHLFGIGMNATMQLFLIAGITMIAVVSVVRGLKSGIQRISQFNVIAAAVLLLFVMILGPTLFILNGFVENVGMYLQNFPQLATWTETYTATTWQEGWTVFYWGWWIAWSPFVGMFIARISRGRTIREFILGVMLIPTFVTFVWLTVFGDGALWIERFGAGGLATAVQENIPVSLFVFLESFPLAIASSLLAVVVVISFFVTSSDSGSLVIDIITAAGNPDPPVPQRVFWAVTEGVVAGVLLLGGGLVALQSAAIATGLPFALVLLLMCWSLHRGLKRYIERYPQAVERPIEPRPLRPAGGRSQASRRGTSGG
ncbi:MAG: BCCT family transporter, partial [Trueperaceae bacterium]